MQSAQDVLVVTLKRVHPGARPECAPHFPSSNPARSRSGPQRRLSNWRPAAHSEANSSNIRHRGPLLIATSIRVLARRAAKSLTVDSTLARLCNNLALLWTGIAHDWRTDRNGLTMESGERTEKAIASATPSAASAITDTRAGPRGAGSGRVEEGQRGPSGSAPADGSARLIDGLRCDLLMNARYHASREAFLDTIHRIVMFLIIALGAAAITDLFPWPWVRSAFAALAAISAAFDLTADLSNRARAHALMKRRYFELLADLAADKRKISEIEECMHRFSADEEPAFHALLLISWNAAQEMVYGDEAKMYKIPPCHRALKNIRRYSESKYDCVEVPKPAVV